MASIRELKRRIKSVKNIAQVTRAMQMVAASKMRKAQDQMASSRPYAQKMLQVIEHLDAEGCSGNLIDVLKFMASDDKRQAYEKGDVNCEKNGLIVNWELKVLMIPPEHRERIEPILQQLRAINP